MLIFESLAFARGAFQISADFSVEEGRKIAILGPSGGGKSTLLSLIAGFERPQSGRVLWQGQDQRALSPGQRDCTIVFQEGNLFPHLSVYQNVALGARPNLRLTRDDHTRVETALASVGIEETQKKPGQLSGGQRARVALARAIVRKKRLLMLDEAFSALGPALKSEMFDLVDKAVAQLNATLLIVTHDPEEAARMDAIIVVEGGQAAAPVSAKALLADPPPGLRAYLGK
ncbi:MAG: ATP-binding cassette domain-containing protein [Pseudomonadota bacterium]